MTRKLKLTMIVLMIVLISVMSTAIGLTAAKWDSQGGASSNYGPNINTIDWNSWSKYFTYQSVDGINGCAVTGYTGTNIGDVIFPLTDNTYGTVKVINNNIFSTTTKELPVTIYISATITTINPSAFSNLPNLQRVIFVDSGVINNSEVPAQAVTVGAYAFAGCTSLQEIIVIGTRSVTFDTTAFVGCTNLTSLTKNGVEQDLSSYTI